MKNPLFWVFVIPGVLFTLIFVLDSLNRAAITSECYDYGYSDCEYEGVHPIVSIIGFGCCLTARKIRQNEEKKKAK